MAVWYYARDGQPGGPVDASRLMQLLASGEVKSGDLVWREGMANWTAAGSVAELRAPVVPTPAITAPQAAANPYPASFSAPHQVPAYYSQQPAEPLPHSGVGVASFIIGLIVGVMEIASIAVAGYLSVQGNAAAKSGGAMALAGFGIIGGIFLCLVGLVLGLVSLSQQRKRVFGILGTTINGGILLLIVVLMVIGLLAK